jgi:hypothetical protein
MKTKILQFKEWLKKAWAEWTKTNPYFYAVSGMGTEGYIDWEILEQMRKESGEFPYEKANIESKEESNSLAEKNND